MALTQAEIKSLVYALLSDASGMESIVNSANLVNDLGLDSMDLAELAISVEEEFDIVVQDEEMDRIRTVGELIQLVEAKVG